MLSHIFMGVGDFQRALSFYAPLMAALGWVLKFEGRSPQDKPWAGWQTPGASRPLFVIGHAYNGEAVVPGNGQMIALLAADRATVDRCHALALAQGGSCEGQPGLRPHYHPNYYGAYFRDRDGNKLCVCCHDPA